MTPLPAALATQGQQQALTVWRLERAVHAAAWAQGIGSERVGGRWSPKGRPVIYAALDPATAILEVAVHAGFEVLDLGINNSVDKYLDALEAEKPDILGMSALLTTTMPDMKVVIDTMKEKGLRDDYIVLVGGAPLNEEFSRAIGADAYCRDAAVAVETAKQYVARKHNQLGA